MFLLWALLMTNVCLYLCKAGKNILMAEFMFLFYISPCLILYRSLRTVLSHLSNCPQYLALSLAQGSYWAEGCSWMHYCWICVIHMYSRGFLCVCLFFRECRINSDLRAEMWDHIYNGVKFATWIKQTFSALCKLYT